MIPPFCIHEYQPCATSEPLQPSCMRCILRCDDPVSATSHFIFLGLLDPNCGSILSCGQKPFACIVEPRDRRSNQGQIQGAAYSGIRNHGIRSKFSMSVLHLSKPLRHARSFKVSIKTLDATSLMPNGFSVFVDCLNAESRKARLLINVYTWLRIVGEHIRATRL